MNYCIFLLKLQLYLDPKVRIRHLNGKTNEGGVSITKVKRISTNDRLHVNWDERGKKKYKLKVVYVDTFCDVTWLLYRKVLTPWMRVSMTYITTFYRLSSREKYVTERTFFFIFEVSSSLEEGVHRVKVTD